MLIFLRIFIESNLKSLQGDLMRKVEKYKKRQGSKKQIEKLFREDKAKNVIDVLNKPVKEIFLKFCNNIKVEGFKTLNEDLKELKQKLIEEGEENINEYRKFRDWKKV